MGLIERARMTWRGIKAINTLPSERQKLVLGQTREQLSSLFTGQILPAMNPYGAVKERFSYDPSAGTLVFHGSTDQTFSLSPDSRILVLGAGKAGVEMGRAVFDVFGDRAFGAINVPENLAENRFSPNIELFPAGHPDPNEGSVRGAQRILELARSATQIDLVIGTISGGGSALLAKPPREIPLEDYITTNRLLNSAGAAIEDWNAVRKHMDREIKGGGLAEAAVDSMAMINLMLSDVTGDRFDVIASGPFTADPSTYAEALAVFDKYGIRSEVPQSVIDYFIAGAEGRYKETSKQNPGNLYQTVIASNTVAVNFTVSALAGLGYPTLPGSVLYDVDVKNLLHGSAGETAKYIAGLARGFHAKHPKERFAIVIGGEPTVNVRAECPRFVAGQSFGGRMQHVAALLMPSISRLPFGAICAATDGGDGYEPNGRTKVAGALIDSSTYGEALRIGIEQQGLTQYPSIFAAFDQTGYREYVDGGNTYGLHDAIGTHFVTGPSGTNVMDIMVLVHVPELARP